MKTLGLAVLMAVLGFGFGSQLHSQVPGRPKTSLEQLQLIKTSNQQMLEKQAATLQKLVELEKESSQLKAFARRG